MAPILSLTVIPSVIAVNRRFGLPRPVPNAAYALGIAPDFGRDLDDQFKLFPLFAFGEQIALFGGCEPTLCA